MRKEPLFLLTSLLFLGSCMENDLYVGEEYVVDNKYMMQESYSVPLQSGKITVVTLGKDTLAVTDSPLTIDVPIGTTTRATSVQSNFVDYASLPEFKTGTQVITGEHLFWFEDSRKCDYDYNDLVLNVHAELTKNDAGIPSELNTYNIRVRGIALGSTKTIGFGFTDVNGVDFDLTDNVRRDYFRSRSGFINTEAGQPYVVSIPAADMDDENKGEYTLVHRGMRFAERGNKIYMSDGYVKHNPIMTTYTKSDNGRLRFTYYIKVDGEKFYVGEYNKNMNGALPYGIRMDARTTTLNIYPLEKVAINEAFPEFINWVKTGNPTDWNTRSKANLSKCYEFNDLKMWAF